MIPRFESMAIVNLTPDSFSDGGSYTDLAVAVDRIRELLNGSNTRYIDIGAESTRPGAELVGEEIEWSRLSGILVEIPVDYRRFISIDTRKAFIAGKVLSLGYTIINDVSGLADSRMLETLAHHGCLEKYILTHNRGIPPVQSSGEANPQIVDELIEYFEVRLDRIRQVDIPLSKVVLDPGLGFGKNVQENLTIIQGLQHLKHHFGLQILIGASRKRFIREIWGVDNLEQGTSIINLLAIQNGADIIRTHDIQHLEKLQHLSNQFNTK